MSGTAIRGGFRLSILAALALLAGAPSTAPAGEVYYVMVFGSQSRPEQRSPRS
jgi:hypothetical protein